MPAGSIECINVLKAEAARSADTHLIRVDLPAFPGIPLYFNNAWLAKQGMDVDGQQQRLDQVIESGVWCD